MIEYSLRQNPINKKYRKASWNEARREVALLAIAGHQKPRAVIDDWNEIAYTCDSCGLWGHTWKPDPMSRFDGNLDAERGGAVFTEKCEEGSVTKKFGYFNIEYALSGGSILDSEMSDRDAKVQRKRLERKNISPERQALVIQKRAEYKRRKRIEAATAKSRS